MKPAKRKAKLQARRKAYDEAMGRANNLKPPGYRRPGSLKK